MEKIKLSELSTLDLIQLERVCTLLYDKNQNEYIAWRSQLSPSGILTYQDSLYEMEEKLKKYTKTRDKILAEIDKRLDNICDE